MPHRIARIIAAFLLASACVFSALPAAAAETKSGTEAGAKSGVAAPAEDLRTPIRTEIRIPVTRPDLLPGSNEDRINQYLSMGKVEDVAQYIGIMYNFLLSIVGLVAAVMMIIGGFQYLTSAGDTGKIGAAKSRMANAFIGMVLAFGAYAILNTINPALLNLKVPDLRAVATQINFLPWCDDLITQGVAVTAAGEHKGCGYVGKYEKSDTATGGTGTQYCIFAGECRAQRFSEDTYDIGEEPNDNEKNGMWATCLQNAGLDVVSVKKQIDSDPNTQLGQCLHCAEITQRKARDMGYGLETACEAWMKSFDSVPGPIKDAEANKHSNRSDIKDGFFYYCGSRTTLQGCAGADIFCYNVTRNDDTVGDDEGNINNGCEGYDESPNMQFQNTITSDGYAGSRYDYDEEGPEDYPEHLGRICALNPCQNYTDPEHGKQYFINGCKGAGISRLAPGVRILTADCRNTQTIPE